VSEKDDDDDYDNNNNNNNKQNNNKKFVHFVYRHASRSTGFLVYVIATWKICKTFNTHVTATLVLNSVLLLSVI
jgi:hypothetical protein